MDIINVDIHQRSAGHLRIESGQYLASLESFISGRILGIVAFYDFDRPQLKEIFLH
ncbi:hypothetical protein D3C80_1896580 [compost metagenome]